MGKFILMILMSSLVSTTVFADSCTDLAKFHKLSGQVTITSPLPAPFAKCKTFYTTAMVTTRLGIIHVNFQNSPYLCSLPGSLKAVCKNNKITGQQLNLNLQNSGYHAFSVTGTYLPFNLDVSAQLHVVSR